MAEVDFSAMSREQIITWAEKMRGRVDRVRLHLIQRGIDTAQIPSAEDQQDQKTLQELAAFFDAIARSVAAPEQAPVDTIETVRMEAVRITEGKNER